MIVLLGRTATCNRGVLCFVTAVLRHSSESTFTVALSVTSRLLFDLKALILPPSPVHRHPSISVSTAKADGPGKISK